MPIPYRRELQGALTEFADSHRGVRLGKMFGLPAIYVGRRLVACLIEDGLIVRLPDDVARREMAKGARPFTPRPSSRAKGGRPLGSWVMYRPRSAAHARRLAPVIETAVANVAERQVEEITGVRLRRK